MSLTRKAELAYHGKTPSLIIGVDEAGRGPLAGPVVTAACFIENGVHIDGINDSKQTKEEEREAMYTILTNHPQVHWAATVVSHTEIDEVNILQATMNGMRRSTEAVHAKLLKLHPDGPFRALIDGNRVPADMPVDATYVIKGDSIIFSIAAASIIAKVTRDRLMLELDKEFPVYNFAQHKGYPTFAHRSLLLKHGPCRVHRTSYAPVKLAMAAHGITNLSIHRSPVTALAAAPKGSGKKVPAKSAISVEATVSAAKAVKAKKAVTKKIRTAKASKKKAKVSPAAASDSAVVPARAGRRAASQSVDSLASLPAQTASGKRAAKAVNAKGGVSARKTEKKIDAAVAAVTVVSKVRRSASGKVTTDLAVEGSVAVDKPSKRSKSVSAVGEPVIFEKNGKKRKAAESHGKKDIADDVQDGAVGTKTRKSARLRQ